MRIQRRTIPPEATILLPRETAARSQIKQAYLKIFWVWQMLRSLIYMRGSLVLFPDSIIESHPNFGKTNFYAASFLPSFLGFKDQQPSSFILIYFFPSHSPGQ